MKFDTEWRIRDAQSRGLLSTIFAIDIAQILASTADEESAKKFINGQVSFVASSMGFGANDYITIKNMMRGGVYKVYEALNCDAERDHLFYSARSALLAGINYALDVHIARMIPAMAATRRQHDAPR